MNYLQISAFRRIQSVIMGSRGMVREGVVLECVAS